MKQPDRQDRAAQVEQGSVSPRKPDQDRLNYLIEEYRMLRTEIESYTKQKRQLEISVITAILIIYGFAATSKLGSILESLVLATPVVVVLWGIYRFISYNRVIKKEVQYVKEKIEPIFMGSEGGWESFWEKLRHGDY